MEGVNIHVKLRQVFLMVKKIFEPEKHFLENITVNERKKYQSMILSILKKEWSFI